MDSAFLYSQLILECYLLGNILWKIFDIFFTQSLVINTSK